jgi:hypothetical protein
LQTKILYNAWQDEIDRTEPLTFVAEAGNNIKGERAVDEAREPQRTIRDKA